MADMFPVVSQLKSLVQVSFGDAEGARRTQENFSRQCPVISQLRSAGEALLGDNDAALETQKEFGRTMSGVADSVPVVGHVKGTIHYAFGDTDGGDNAMKAASRTTGALAAGAVGFLAAGPPGAVALGVAGAGAMDSVTTIVDSAVHGESRPAGYCKQISDIIDNPTDSGTYFDTAFMLVGDGATGYAGGKMVEYGKSYGQQRQIRKHFEAERAPLENKVGKSAAKDMVNAADRMKEVRQKYAVPDNKPHITSVVHDLETGKHFDGHNQQVRQFCKKVPEDAMSDYSGRNSKTYFEQKVPDAKPPLGRSPKTCAEHRAYDKFYKNDINADPARTRVATVRYDKHDRNIKAVKRCDNCKAYDKGMGEVPADCLDNEVVPNHPGVGKYSYHKEAGKAAGAAGGTVVFHGKDDKASQRQKKKERKH